MATAGDVNGDGYNDGIIGAAQYDNGPDLEGRAFLYLGSAAGLGTSASWTAGCNGDGFSDVIAGANLYDNGQENEGEPSFTTARPTTGLPPHPGPRSRAFSDVIVGRGDGVPEPSRWSPVDAVR